MLKSRSVYGPAHEQFRDTVRRFAEKDIAPYFQKWESDGIVDRHYWQQAGKCGLLCPQVPELYSGTGGDFRFNTIIIEELWYAGFAGPAADVSVHNDVCAGYILSCGNDAQKQLWLPGMVSGDLVCAIAMTEPGTGSDLQGIRTRARREGDDYIISGAKTFISNGQHADIVIAVVQTNPDAGSRGMSLIVVETNRPGFRRGRNLDKLGHHSADTSELFFDDVRVPVANRLGAEGGAMAMLMTELPQERLTIAYQSMAAAQRAFDITKIYVAEREVFGKSVLSYQNTRYKLADLKADLSVGWAYVDQCLAEHIAGQLTTTSASTAKLWATEMHGRVVDQCLQFFGGYGFMREYEICRLYADARVQRIYGGTSEIMRELISRTL